MNSSWLLCSLGNRAPGGDAQSCTTLRRNGDGAGQACLTLAECADLANSPNVRTVLLAAEILSPSTSRQDRFTKRRLYQDVGIPTAWFVDCDARQVEAWTPEAIFPIVESARLAWHPAGAGKPFVLELEALFRTV